jgi:hypothetical protein
VCSSEEFKVPRGEPRQPKVTDDQRQVQNPDSLRADGDRMGQTLSLSPRRTRMTVLVVGALTIVVVVTLSRSVAVPMPIPSLCQLQVP